MVDVIAQSRSVSGLSAIDGPGVDLIGALPFPAILLDSENRFLWVNHSAECFFHSSLSILVGTGLERIISADSYIFSLIRRVHQTEISVEESAISFVSPKFGVKLATVQLAMLAKGHANGDHADSEHAASDYTGSEQASSDHASSDRVNILMTLQEKTEAQQLATQNDFKSAALSLSSMTALLAHEIKNPLAGIKGAAQLLEMEIDKSQHEYEHELSGMIVTEADRITSLLQRIETMSSGVPANFEAVNIHEILDHCLKITQASFGRHLDIKRQYDPSLPDIQADREMLIPCFINLLKNASEATKQGDSLTISTSFSLTCYMTCQTSQNLIHLPIQIDLADSGEGIKDELLAHIFEPFVSGKSGGSGLGLAMVANVIGDHGGAIATQSSEQGAHFTLNLPIKADHTKKNKRGL